MCNMNSQTFSCFIVFLCVVTKTLDRPTQKMEWSRLAQSTWRWIITSKHLWTQIKKDMCKECPVILQNDVLHWGRGLHHGQVRSMKQKFQHTEQMHNSNQALHDSHSHCATRQPTFHNHEPLLFRLLHSSNGLLLKAPLCLPKFPK